MKPGYSGNYQDGSGQRPRDPLSSAAYAYLQQANRQSLGPRGGYMSGGGGWPVGTPISARNEFERFMGMSNSSGVALPMHHSSGYIPPGTHFVPPGFGESQQTYSRHRHNQGGGRYSLPPGAFQRPHNPHGHSPSVYANYTRNAAAASSLFGDEDDPFFPVETLPPLARRERFSMEFGGGYSLPSLDERDERTHEQFGERLASFPELPTDAHKRIFQMGNEIMDCFEVRLERFYRGSLLDSAENCVAVFTKKERTGQRWLMVFKEDISRSIVKFNRLLTHSLIVSVTSATAIEIEAAKSVYGPPAEMCVLNFRNVEEAERFYETLHESQTTAWNHREVSQEQKMKSLLSKLNVALSQTDMLISPSSAGGRPLTPPSRSPFTLSSLRDPCDLLRSIGSRPETAPASPAQQDIADLDQDWRSRRMSTAERQDQGDPAAGPFVTVTSSVAKKVRSALTSSKMPHSFVYDSMTYANALKKMDGSGDRNMDAENEVLPKEEIAWELFDVTVYVKNEENENYEELNKGTLQLIDHGESSIDEIKFIGRSNEELCQQYIFKWNTISKKSKPEGGKGSVFCFWDGAATLRHAPNDVPDVRKFKIKVEDEETADNFINIFHKSLEKSMDAKARRSHVRWFMKSKGQSLFNNHK